MAKKSGGAGSGGWVSIPEKFRTSFPKDMFESRSRGGYRISDRYIDPYRDSQTRKLPKGWGLKNPYSPLNIKINGAQKNFSASSNKLFSKGFTFAWLRKHLIGVVERINVNALNYTVILSLRAQKIFQDSFKYKKFYSASGSPWEPLAESTIKKRQRKRTWPGAGGMLREYGDMFKSIKVRNSSGKGFIGGVYTDPSEYVQHHYINTNGKRIVDKRGIFCYAGLHNAGGKIRGGHRLPKRQFMGHSTYLFEFALAQADRYFFFNVFD